MSRARSLACALAVLGALSCRAGSQQAAKGAIDAVKTQEKPAASAITALASDVARSPEVREATRQIAATGAESAVAPPASTSRALNLRPPTS